MTVSRWPAHLYFAYGSNLDAGQMRKRCPDHEVVGPARLDNHVLRFRGFSRGWGGATATVELVPGNAVWGVVYRLSDADIPELDAYEGYYGADHTNNLYDRGSIRVTFADGAPAEVFTYRIRPHPEGPPSRRYLEVIVAWARRHHLPEDYVEQLARHATRESGGRCG